MPPDDKRTAVGFSVTLSSQLIAAALAILAIEGAYVAYALGERATASGFLAAAAIAAICFAGSVFVAGKAITESRNAGFEGSWSLEAGKQLYNRQAILLLIGLMAFAVALGRSGNPKTSTLTARVESHKFVVDSLALEVQSLIEQQQRLRDSVNELRRTFQRLEEGEANVR